MNVLLDTNVLSELLRERPDPVVLAWFASQPANGLFVSAVRRRLRLATRNDSSFEGCGITLTNPRDIDERAEGLRWRGLVDQVALP